MSAWCKRNLKFVSGLMKVLKCSSKNSHLSGLLSRANSCSLHLQPPDQTELYEGRTPSLFPSLHLPSIGLTHRRLSQVSKFLTFSSLFPCIYSLFLRVSFSRRLHCCFVE